MIPIIIFCKRISRNNSGLQLLREMGVEKFLAIMILMLHIIDARI